MASRTKEVDQQIEQLRKERDLIVVREREEQNARTVRTVYQSYIDAGFTEEQAWEIFITLLKK